MIKPVQQCNKSKLRLNNWQSVKYQVDFDNKGEADFLIICSLQQRVGCIGALL